MTNRGRVDSMARSESNVLGSGAWLATGDADRSAAERMEWCGLAGICSGDLMEGARAALRGRRSTVVLAA